MGNRRRLFAITATSYIVAMSFIGGYGGVDDPGSSNIAQRSGSSCPLSGMNTTPSTPASLCPAAPSYTTTYIGSSGSDEYIKVRFDTSKNTYQMQFLESSVPTSAGQINTTRKGLITDGMFIHPADLPAREQNRCAFALQSGKVADNSYATTVSPQDSPMLFVGQDIVGGGILGVTIQFVGIQPIPGVVTDAVPSRMFDSYPLLGSSETVTDFSQAVGCYSQVGVHVTSTGSGNQTSAPQGWQPDTVNWTQALKADGSYTVRGTGYSCHTMGMPWTLCQNTGGSQDNMFVNNPVSSNAPYPYVGQVSPLALLALNQAKGILTAGKPNEQVMLVMIRVGYSHSDPTNLLAPVAGDQVSISILLPVIATPTNALEGGFVGAIGGSACGVVTSNGPSGASASGNGSNITVDHPELSGPFNGGSLHASAGNCSDETAVSTLIANYTSMSLRNNITAFINPLTSRMAAQSGLDYTQNALGKLAVTAQSNFNAQGASGNVTLFKAGDTGVVVKVDNVCVMLMNNSKYNSFFTVSAFVQ